MIIDLYEDVLNGGSSYVKLHMKDLSVLNHQNKKDNLCGIWCIFARLHPVKVNACGSKNYENHFDTIITTGINLENDLYVKDPKI